MKYSLILALLATLGLSACEKTVNNPAPVVAAPDTVVVPVAVPGPAGEPGKTGADGASGASGATGATGATGNAGDAGTPGADGAKGDTGKTGKTGGDTVIVVPPAK